MTETVEPGYIRSAAYELTRPGDTTAYASGDAMANSDTAASVVPMEFAMASPDAYAVVSAGRVSSYAADRM